MICPKWISRDLIETTITSADEHHLRYTKIVNRAKTEEEELQDTIINIKKIIRIIRTLHFIFRITVSFQNQFINITTKYQITTSAETAAGVCTIILFFRLPQFRSTVLRILYLVSAILYSVHLLYLIICIYSHQSHLPNIFLIIDLKVALSIIWIRIR